MHDAARFQGRQAELAWLRRLWDGATTRDEAGQYSGGPRMAFVVAETGLGKTRLVQEFYSTLSAEASWNAPDPYWPIDLHTNDGRLLVNPEFEGWTPEGAPRFLWLGARWQPPDQRNVEERTCVLPALHAVLQAHVRVAQTHAPRWRRLRRSAERLARQEATDGFAENLADLSGVPFGGLLVKVARAGASLFETQSSAAAETRRMHDSAADTLLTDLREVFGGFGGGGLILPTVLWLDDAQWIDPVTLAFFIKLWREAVHESWPLLVIVTHWEREWHQIQRAAADGQTSLAAFAGDPRAEVLILGETPPEDLSAWLRARLPGLTQEQHQLLIDKAGGNFLTLVENVGALVQQPANFVGRRLDAALTPAGERRVMSWESERHRRVEQRFQEIEPDLQDLLGWSSHIGQQFLWKAPASFAQMRTGTAADEVRARLDACVRPYAILGVTAPYAREFRDRALHMVAARYFKDYLADTDEEPLTTATAHLLAAWVNASIEGDDAALEAAGLPSLLHLTLPDAMQVLDMTARYLPLAPWPEGWENQRCAAPLRAAVLRVVVAAGLDLWDAVGREVPAFTAIEWDDVPVAAVPAWLINRAGMAIGFSSGYDAARAMLEYGLRVVDARPGEGEELAGHILHNLACVEHDRTEFEMAAALFERALEIKTQTLGPDHPQTATTMNAMGQLYYDLGRLDDARMMTERALAIWEQSSDAAHPDVSIGLHNLAQIHSASGAIETALEYEKRAVELRERLLGPDHHEVAIMQNGLAGLYQRLGRFDEARNLLERALATTTRVHGSESAVLVPVLNNLGELERQLARFDEADGYYQRAEGILERTTDGAHPNIAAVCANRALTMSQRGRPDLARPLYERALALREAVYGSEHPKVAASLDDLSVCLMKLGELDEADGYAARALAIRERLFPPDHPDIAQSLNNMGFLKLQRGDYEGARAALERCLGIRERAFGSDHVDLAVPLNNLAETCLQTGRADEAEAYFKRSLAVRERAYGPTHPSVVLALNNFAQFLRGEGRLDEAEPLLLRALAETEAMGDPAGNLKSLLTGLASLYDERGDAEKGAAFRERALAAAARSEHR